MPHEHKLQEQSASRHCGQVDGPFLTRTDGSTEPICEASPKDEILFDCPEFFLAKILVVGQNASMGSHFAGCESMGCIL